MGTNSAGVNWQSQGNAELLSTGIFSDVTLTCSGEEWRLHRSILCTRSKWFRTALMGDFAEAQSGAITISDTSARTMKQILEYIYTGVVLEFGGKDLGALDVSLFITAADFFLLSPAIDYGTIMLRRVLARYAREAQDKAKKYCQEASKIPLKNLKPKDDAGDSSSTSSDDTDESEYTTGSNNVDDPGDVDNPDISEKSKESNANGGSHDVMTEFRSMGYTTFTQFWAGVGVSFQRGTDKLTEDQQAYCDYVVNACHVPIDDTEFMRTLKDVPSYSIALLHMFRNSKSFLWHNLEAFGAVKQCIRCHKNILAKTGIRDYYMTWYATRYTYVPGFRSTRSYVCCPCYKRKIEKFGGRNECLVGEEEK